MRRNLRCSWSWVLVLGVGFAVPQSVGGEADVLGEVAKVLAPDAQAFDLLGENVSLEGDRLLASASGDDDAAGLAGAAYVFERDTEGAWVAVAKLVASDGQGGDELGSAVSLDGDRAAVGASGDRANGFNSGSVYLFERQVNGGWSQLALLLAADGESSDSLGWAVSLDGSRLAAGAPFEDEAGVNSGAVYLYEEDAPGSWSQVTKLVAPEAEGSGNFGEAVSLDGDRLLVGASGDDDNGTNAGAVYVYDRAPDGTWSESQKIIALDGEARDSFGQYVSLDGDRLAVSAHLDDDVTGDAGAVYLYERDASGVWIQVSKITPADGVGGGLFGISLSLDGDRLAVGASGDDDRGDLSGSAYLFERDELGAWNLFDKLAPLDGEPIDNLGFGVALDGDRVAAGAWRDDDRGSNAGAVYILETVTVSPQLSVTGTCPGDIAILATELTPTDQVRLFGSQAAGQGVVAEGPCAGSLLELDQPRDLITLVSGSDGAFTLERTAAAGLCGGRLQLLDERTCLVSPVALLPGSEGTPE